MNLRALSFGALSLLLLPLGAEIAIEPVLATQPVREDADDPAIWVHPTDPARSLIFGTDKVKVPEGALHVFGLDGKTVRTLEGVDHANNVDVEYGFSVGGKTVDLAVATEREQRRLRIWSISPDGETNDVTGSTKVHEGEEGERGAPMGIALYRRPSDGAIFACVTPKEGPTEGYFWQYRLVENAGKVDAVFVRRFGSCKEGGEIEALVVDDELGLLYGAEEGFGIRQYTADPDAAEANRELGLFATEPYGGDREGLAIFATGPGKGYLVSTEQMDGGSKFRIYRREGLGSDSKPVAVLSTSADATDGIEVTSRPLGDKFPQGLLITMNSKDKNFWLFDGGVFGRLKP